MKLIFSFSLLLCSFVSAEEPANGYLRLANALAQGTGPLQLAVDGKSLTPDGYQPGDFTGEIPLSPGTQSVKFSRQPLPAASTTVVIAADETSIVIPFAEEIPASPTVAAHWEIRVLRLKPPAAPTTGMRGTFVSVAPAPEIRLEIREPSGKWNLVFLKPRTPAQAALLYPRGYVPLRAVGRDLPALPVVDRGNYFVILYNDATGKLQTIHFHDQKSAVTD
jgi:hypothetical protein